MNIATDLTAQDLNTAVNVLNGIAESYPRDQKDALILRAAVNIATARALDVLNAVGGEQDD
jgi:hypothetical protein